MGGKNKDKGLQSKTKRISDARDQIVNLVCQYAKLAQDVDLSEEDDIGDLESQIDVVLEALVFKQER